MTMNSSSMHLLSSVNCPTCCILSSEQVAEQFKKSTNVTQFRKARLRPVNHKRALTMKIVMQHKADGSIERNDRAATGPLVKPEPELLAEDCVKLQLDALSSNNHPRVDHGLEVLYNFANAEGALDGSSLPCYFGYAADLYHFGHFAMKFKTRNGKIINLKGYKVLSCEEFFDLHQNILRARVCVEIFERDNNVSLWTFVLSKKARGNVAPCWLTDSLLITD
ncbi:hypothetical protein SUGI_0098930 [Cryptomeria japonica]|uniref:uncharacterized protein LOC131050940 n=1 Tax=Cryptomeria japonica TaxID=3369 RepID=UPI002408CB76|nr:uncharacterized protein LOC131050940 [Cryptomeria japonica]GLJ08944.1 hypothetical protein SUGI_0098930 [Cryptomeria japonica]